MPNAEAIVSVDTTNTARATFASPNLRKIDAPSIAIVLGPKHVDSMNVHMVNFRENKKKF